MAASIRCLFVCLSLLLMFPAHAKAPDRNDVRVLIDISGSMKQNDPQNLRRPALRMLVGLLQPGTRAGVWTFAKWSNPLVPLAEVDEAWKKKALSLSQQIQSPGMFTDVERVLGDALQGWSGEPVTHNRHLLLLTDGMVDVSKKPGESAASRVRILENLLPQLQALGVKVHTIALSDRADHDLMQQLSSGTGGWYQQVEGADQLKRVFLKVFEQVGKPEGVPLRGNRFTVDASVREATILLFREEGAKAPALVSPSGARYTESDLIAGVAWYLDEGYDLVTISSPEQGEWILEADVDPDNRVMIVTDLKLETSELPAHLAVGDSLRLSANLASKGKVVRRKAFLRLLDVRAEALSEGKTDSLGLNDEGRDGDEKAADGRYSAKFKQSQASEEVELLVSIESATFMREKRFLVAVHEPAQLTLEGSGADTVAIASVHDAVMAPDAVLEVWQEVQGERRLLQAEDGSYPLLDPEQPVFLRVEGKSRLGNLVSRRIGPVYPEGVQPAPEPEPVNAAPLEEAPAEAPQPEPAQEEAVAEQPTEEDGWLMPAIVFGVSNLVLLLVGGGAWWFLRRRGKGEADASLMDDIAAMDTGMDISEGTGESAAESPHANPDEKPAEAAA